MDTQIQFPSYIGFGKLKPETVHESEEAITADYFFLDKAVHRVTFNKKRGYWSMKDIFEDNTGIQSGSAKLAHLAIMHFNGLDCKTNSIFEYVLRAVCHRGNIYFEYLSSCKDKGLVVSYHPAGRLLILRLPIFMSHEGREKAWILVKEVERKDEDKKLLKLCDSYCTSILVTKRNGDKEAIPVLMLEYIVPLAFVYDAADWICSRNLISREKIFRMVIQDSVKKTTRNMQTFRGDDEYAAFTILFKGFDDEKIDFEKSEKKFVESFNYSD